MTDNLWENIEKNYEIAKQCLWCPKQAKSWRRDENKGLYHLWQAYYSAINASEKEELLYARILMMMNQEQRQLSIYERFHRYVKPAIEAYSCAKALNRQLYENEFAEAKLTFDRLQYELDRTSETENEYNNAYGLIDGLNDIEEFQFHDSKPVYFEHTADRALLKLDYNGLEVALEFRELFEVYVNCDPVCDWINEFYCYRLFDIPEHIMFDVGFYRIVCKEVRVVEKLQNSLIR